MESRNKRFFIWLPVILLPLSNILVSFITHVLVSQTIEWIIGAVAEELFFRFFLLKTVLLPRVKPTLAIILTSILFAGMHLFNLRTGQPLDKTLLQMGCAFAFGIWAGAVTWKFTFPIPLMAHILMNATAMAEVICVSLVVDAVVLIDGIILMKGENSV